MILTMLTLPNSELVDSSTRLNIWGASIDSVLRAFTTSGGTPSGAIVVAIFKFCNRMQIDFLVILEHWNKYIIMWNAEKNGKNHWNNSNYIGP